VAALAPSDAPAPVFLVRVAPDGQAVVVAAGAPAPPTGRALELWALTPGSSTPVSLGLLEPTGQRHLTVPNRAGTQLMVSQEPVGGSPTGQPTGPVLYKGTLTGA
jgi:anti-sigma-K factor RskA